MNDNIKVGADIHAGDGGYSLGTKEKYDEFVKGRNQSLGKMRIRELAEQATTYIEPTSNSGEGWIFNKEKFAELIVRECGEVAYKAYWNNPETVRGVHIQEKIKQHFGVEE
jgi:hypothetical protein